MHIEQFKGKKIAVYGLDNIGKLFVNFLNKNAISVVILDESDIDYSIFQNQELSNKITRYCYYHNNIFCKVYKIKSFIKFLI